MRQFTLRQRTLYHLDQVVVIERLGDVIIGAGLDRFDRAPNFGEGGDDDDRQAGINLSGPAQQVNAADVGQMGIQQKNFVFASVGEIDTEEFSDEARWHALRRDTKTGLKQYVDYCTKRGLPATYYHDYGTDVIDTVSRLTERISADFPNAVFFAAKLIFERENFATNILHNQTAYMIQKRLHVKGQNLIIMPMKI